MNARTARMLARVGLALGWSRTRYRLLKRRWNRTPHNERAAIREQIETVINPPHPKKWGPGQRDKNRSVLEEWAGS